MVRKVYSTKLSPEECSELLPDSLTCQTRDGFSDPVTEWEFHKENPSDQKSLRKRGIFIDYDSLDIRNANGRIWLCFRISRTDYSFHIKLDEIEGETIVTVTNRLPLAVCLFALMGLVLFGAVIVNVIDYGYEALMVLIAPMICWFLSAWMLRERKKAAKNADTFITARLNAMPKAEDQL